MHLMLYSQLTCGVHMVKHSYNTVHHAVNYASECSIHNVLLMIYTVLLIEVQDR